MQLEEKERRLQDQLNMLMDRQQMVCGKLDDIKKQEHRIERKENRSALDFLA